ncbi:MAG: hypothetical protein E5V66_05250 [Mesorhizobium sp.]|uniref:hypothetical protein n=1 Tax=Mesorhizobium sp. TaxID=1871066 RepID=UPI000FE47119|nr:hypothetical protein [Mesorhizobium sp.]RWD38319.1 MAG: hypothetical protein EOS33_00350 [Mesorhizobium sp.]TIW13216.1 MAG: hypothetical protein E5V66_05250 [Mesorhizobium sp.]TIW37395.1 MAG: hypothetical protein E5V62_01670 [Mesorhizobium sp.]
MHLRYSRVRLEAKLFNGKLASCEVELRPGANLILTDSNTQGKSTLVNALAVGLGLDDLVKGNVAALVKDTLRGAQGDQRIVEAAILLEIANASNELLTIRRSVKPELSRGMLVRRGPLSQWSEAGLEEYYLGSGSYTDTRGFHRLLSEFIGFPEVQVISQDDGVMRLYLEYIFSAIFIEQKRGWADIMANMPYYRVRDPKKSTIAELLGLDYIRNNLQRNALRLDEQRLKARYDTGIAILRRHVNGRQFSIRGIPSDIGVGSFSPQIFRVTEGERQQSLADLLSAAEADLASKIALADLTPPDPSLQSRIDEISKRITALVTRKSELDNAIAAIRGNVRRYQQRLEVLARDLQKNKEELKIRRLFNRDEWAITSACPVCEQSIDGTLLSQMRSFPTMSIDENVEYITDQRNLLQDIISVEIARRERHQVESEQLGKEISIALTQQSEIQKSLAGAIPSELMARARDIARIENAIGSYRDLLDQTSSELAALLNIWNEYLDVAGKLSKLRSDLSANDQSLLRQFQRTFRDYLGRLGFNSFEIGSMVIDEGSFMPRVIVNDRDRRVRADFGTSASDWIRIITAFVLALHASRDNSQKSNHPNLTVFDEPAQQNIDRQDYLKFFDIVADVCRKGGQVIVAATDKDHAVRARAQGLHMHVIDFGSEYILR